MESTSSTNQGLARFANVRSVFSGSGWFLTVLPGLYFVYGLFGEATAFNGFVWACTVTFAIFCFGMFAVYCSTAQKTMQMEIDRMSKQKEEIEKVLLRRRLSSKKGGV